MAKTLKKSMKKPHRKISRQKRRTQKRGGDQDDPENSLKYRLNKLPDNPNAGPNNNGLSGGGVRGARSIYVSTVRILYCLIGAIKRNNFAQEDETKLGLLRSSNKILGDTITIFEKGTTLENIEPDIKLVQEQTLKLLKIINVVEKPPI